MTKPAIVILHGWGLSSLSMDPLTKELRKHSQYSVFAPDLPGFGKSREPDYPLTLFDYEEFLREYIVSNKIVKPIIIGHSFGGRIALLYEKMNKGKVSGLVLSGTPGYFSTSIIKKIRKAMTIAIAKVGSSALSMFPNSSVRQIFQEWYYYHTGIRDFTHAKGVMKETFKLVVATEMEPLMKQVSTKTLLLWGGHDRLVSTGVAKKMERTIPESKLVILPTGDHSVLFKNFIESAIIIREFISSV